MCSIACAQPLDLPLRPLDIQGEARRVAPLDYEAPCLDGLLEAALALDVTLAAMLAASVVSLWL